MPNHCAERERERETIPETNKAKEEVSKEKELSDCEKLVEGGDPEGGMELRLRRGRR